MLLRVCVALALLALCFLAFRHMEKSLPTAEQDEKARLEGAAFGASRDSEQCLAEAFRRGVACNDDSGCELTTQHFLRGCLAAGALSPHFCDGVPDSFHPIDSQTYFTELWRAHGKPHHGGIVAEDAIKDFCHPAPARGGRETTKKSGAP